MHHRDFGFRLLYLGLLSIGFTPGNVWGQAAASASIVGKAVDASGAAIPGISIQVTSPALQVPHLDVITDEVGSYKVLDLPAPGVYRITFELPGFQTYVRDGLNLGVGFSARVDAVMQVGEVTETVEVTGQSPVVDTVSTAGSTNLQLEQIQTTPTGTGIQDMLPLAAGVSLSSKPDVGDSNLALRSAIITYGVVLQPTLNVEGINTTSAHEYDTATYLDAFSLAEVELKTSGNNADVAFPGVNQIAIMKSGSNQFHGGAQAFYENPKFQGNNIDSVLAGPPNNLKNSNPLSGIGYYNYAVGLGGRIIRDKLWFFASTTKPTVKQGLVNTVAAPDPNCPQIAGSQNGWNLSKCPNAKPALLDQALPEYDFKVSYQLSPKVKLIGARMWGRKLLSANGAGANSPIPADAYELLPATVWKGEIQAAPSNRLLIDAQVGHGGYFVHYYTQPSSQMKPFGYSSLAPDFVGDPSQKDSSNLVTGPALGPNDRPQNRYEANGSVSFIPSSPHLGGKHQLKFGTALDWEIAASRVLKDNIAGDYQLVFSDNFGPGTPSQIVIWNFPVPTQTNRLFSQAFYVTDSYTVGRVTINAGVRAERYHSFYPDQTKPAGQFSTISDKNGPIFPAATYPGRDVLTWKDVVPRLGAAWDVMGNGKTVVKASASLFGDTMGDLFAVTFNPNNLASNTYPWLPTQPNGACVTNLPAPAYLYDEFKCDVNPAWFKTTLPTLAPTSQTGGTTQVPNPGLKQNKTYEYVVKLERELVPNVAVSAGYIHHRLYSLYNSGSNATPSASTDVNGSGINIGHPYSSYTIPVTFMDGLTGKPITLYTYPAGVGDNTNEVLSTPSSRPDLYHTFELTMTKRYSKKWDALASFWETKNHRWLQAISGSPNDDRFPIDDTWNWEARGNISYHLPYNIHVSSLYRAQSGIPGQRTQRFTSGSCTTNPPSATCLRQGTQTYRMGSYGEYRGPVVAILNLRVARKFVVKESQGLEVSFQEFNLLNNNAATSTNYLTGATTFGVVTGIVSARVARIGLDFSF